MDRVGYDPSNNRDFVLTYCTDVRGLYSYSCPEIFNRDIFLASSKGGECKNLFYHHTDKFARDYHG